MVLPITSQRAGEKMIYALKHAKSGKYVAGAEGPVMQEPFVWDLAGNVVQAKWIWSGKTDRVRFALTDNLLQARQIEDPDMEMVYKFGLEPEPLKLTKGTLERAYKII